MESSVQEIVLISRNREAAECLWALLLQTSVADGGIAKQEKDGLIQILIISQ
jgi:hypothetical protein